MKTTYSVHGCNGPMFGEFRTIKEALSLYDECMAMHKEDPFTFSAVWIEEDTVSSRKVSALEIEEERG